MFPFEIAIPDGTPWLDHKEATKTGPELKFIFRIEKFLYFNLREIMVYYVSQASGVPQLPLKVEARVSSTQNLFIPVPVPVELFSSPSQNFQTGTLNEAAQGGRLIPSRFNYPANKGDTYTVSITGTPTAITIGCMLSGRKYGGERWV